MTTATPPRTQLPGGLSVSRIMTGLWQIADLERTGTPLDADAAAGALDAYADAGFDSFDMADHYGSAEIVAGRLIERRRERDVSPAVAFTKWCPVPGAMTPAIVRAGVEERLRRLKVDKVDCLQFHWWTFEHSAWIDALHALKELRDEGLIGLIGLTNFDAAHLALAIADGIPVATNQVSFSLVDRRAAGELSTVCRSRGTRLLAYGTLCGGFLGERWLGKPEPASEDTWSQMKYKRFIDAAGGWGAFQGLLRAAAAIADRHNVSIANVATRWVLDHPAVAAVIIGARPGLSEHRADNLRLFDFTLDAEDHERLDAAFTLMKPIPGDCGDEYRRPPYLTASGDLSHHFDLIEPVFHAETVPGRPDRQRVSSGSVWEPLAGFSRAMRIGDRIVVSGTTATHGSDVCVAPGDAGAQAVYILDKIGASLSALGGGFEDVIRTRVYLKDVGDWEAVSRAHGRVFGAIRPANTLLQAGELVGGYKVEIEAEAVLPPCTVATSGGGSD
ncbi:MAG: aldo/keto reductase [Rhizobiaceae bacterium]|nr:MAG: aldo/keto reductase [Rhizobiaceae bacterium]